MSDAFQGPAGDPPGPSFDRAARRRDRALARKRPGVIQCRGQPGAPMPRIAAIGVVLWVAVSASGCATARPDYVLAATEGEARAQADRRCRGIDRIARSRLFLQNALATECVIPGRPVDDRAIGLTDGTL